MLFSGLRHSWLFSFVIVIVKGFGAKGLGLLHGGRAAFCVSIFSGLILMKSKGLMYVMRK